MGLISILNHLFNFVLPAFAVGTLVAVLAPLMMRKARPARSWWRQALVNAAVCSVVLLAGLACFSHDGKMVTYAAMVVACATCQWMAGRGWRG